jgi:hypothetical protein
MKASFATIVKTLPYFGLRRKVDECFAPCVYDIILDLANIGFVALDIPFVVATRPHHFRSFFEPIKDIAEQKPGDDVEGPIYPIYGYREGGRECTERLSIR